MSKVIEDNIEKAKALAGGLTAKLALVKDKGIDEAFVSRIEAEMRDLVARNDELERRRKDFHDYAHATNEVLDEMKQQIKTAKKIVKMNYPQEKWIQFGISDKR
jgi:uncharacterized protein (UPF0305 family)